MVYLDTQQTKKFVGLTNVAVVCRRRARLQTVNVGSKCSGQRTTRPQ